MLSGALGGLQALPEDHSDHSDARPTTLEADSQLRRRVLNFLVGRRLGTTLPDIRVRGGVVTVTGRVPTLKHRWLVCLCCEHVAGVLHVIDELEVGPCLCDSRFSAKQKETAIVAQQPR